MQVRVAACRDCGVEWCALPRRGRPLTRCPGCSTQRTPRRSVRYAAAERPCEHCGRSFIARLDRVGRFCSQGCARLAGRTLKGTSRTCVQCCGSFTPKHKRQRFCGHACVAASRVLPKHLRKPKKSYPGRKVRKYGPFTCEHCGDRFLSKAKDRNRFCTREHAYAFFAARKAERLARPKPRPQPEPIPPRSCLECGAVFIPVARHQARCSDACRAAKARRKHHEAIARRPVARKVCRYCGGEFWRKKERHAIYCGAACCKKANRDRRRDMERGAETVEVVPLPALVRRDKGICHICLAAVRLDVDLMHAMAPTRDHILPVTKGGKTEWANIKLAHRGCNSRRGNRVAA
jgi:hypothetical protein